MLLGGHTAMWTILAVGFFNSIMFPTIFSLGVAELGPLTGNGSGLLNMAIVGGAILPVIQGAIADQRRASPRFVLPVICYLYILFYASERIEAEQRAVRRNLSDKENDMNDAAGRRYRRNKDGASVFSRKRRDRTRALAEAEVHSADYPSLEAIAKEFLAKTGLQGGPCVLRRRRPGTGGPREDHQPALDRRPGIHRKGAEPQGRRIC